MFEFRTQLKLPENPKEKILIDIPCNLWTEFGKKGMLEVDITINGIPFNNIGLLPRGNGMYSIKYTKQLQSKLKNDSLNELFISIQLSEPVLQSGKSPGKEYLKINKPNLVMQTTSGNCGQACISMLTGICIDDVCKLMGTSGGTTIGQIMDALNQYNVRHAEKNIRLSKKNLTIPDISILTVHFPEYTHWVLYYKGIYYDPEFGKMTEYANGKITSYLECFEC